MKKLEMSQKLVLDPITKKKVFSILINQKKNFFWSLFLNCTGQGGKDLSLIINCKTSIFLFCLATCWLYSILSSLSGSIFLQFQDRVHNTCWWWCFIIYINLKSLRLFFSVLSCYGLIRLYFFLVYHGNNLRNEQS